MRNKKGFTGVELLFAVIFLGGIIGYVLNIVKLVRCDFKEPYKAEVVHALGLVTGLGAVTGWSNVGK